MSTRSKRKGDDNKGSVESGKRPKGEGEAGKVAALPASDEAMSPTGPFVLYCSASSSCRTIIGDSLSIIGSNEVLKTVSLRRASNVTRQEALKTSVGKDVDQGATFFPIDCEQCKKTIGRYYITTPRELDDVRHCLTFFVDKLSSYVLGSGQIGDDNDSGGLGEEDGKIENEEELDELSQMQFVVGALERRISALEDSMRRVAGALRLTASPPS